MDPVPNEKPADGSRSEQAVPMPDEPPAYNPEWIDPQNKQYAAMVLTEYRDYNLPLPHGPVTVADASSKVSIVPTCPECVSGLVHEQFTTCDLKRKDSLRSIFV